MTTFFTSDTHFGHARIIDLCGRPFRDVDHMNDEIVRRWNKVVAPGDTVFHLGDVALGKIADSLPQVGRLNGYKVLVEGNHDRPFMEKRKPEKRKQWLMTYQQYFDEIHAQFPRMPFSTGWVNLSHYPYDGDSHGEDRYADERLVDGGLPLIHGHTHSSGAPVSYSAKGTLQIHVGMDAHNFYPVHEDYIRVVLARNPWNAK